MRTNSVRPWLPARLSPRARIPDRREARSAGVSLAPEARACWAAKLQASSSAAHRVARTVGAHDLREIAHGEVARTEVTDEGKAVRIRKIAGRDAVALEVWRDDRRESGVRDSWRDGPGGEWWRSAR